MNEKTKNQIDLTPVVEKLDVLIQEIIALRGEVKRLAIPSRPHASK